MMPSGTHPAAILFINVPPQDVDVNVHPAKTQVRFLRESAVLAFVRDAVANGLRATQPITRIPHVTREAEPWSRASTRSPVFHSNTTQPSGDMADRPPVTPPIAGASARSDSRGLETDRDNGSVAETFMPRDTTPPPEIDDSPGDPTPDIYRDELSGLGSAEVEAVSLPGMGHGIKPLGQIRDSRDH
jgi:DNA mismatch repair protein MutL